MRNTNKILRWLYLVLPVIYALNVYCAYRLDAFTIFRSVVYLLILILFVALLIWTYKLRVHAKAANPHNPFGRKHFKRPWFSIMIDCLECLLTVVLAYLIIWDVYTRSVWNHEAQEMILLTVLSWDILQNTEHVIQKHSCHHNKKDDEVPKMSY